MSNFSQFMKANKKKKENGYYAATKSLCDEKGTPLKWEFRHITSKEDEDIREDCMVEVPVKGKPNLFRPRLQTSRYLRRMIEASVVVPDLKDADLQDSYGVKKPEDLLMALVDDPGEYNELAAWVQNFQGFSTSFEEEVAEAKN